MGPCQTSIAKQSARAGRAALARAWQWRCADAGPKRRCLPLQRRSAASHAGSGRRVGRCRKTAARAGSTCRMPSLDAGETGAVRQRPSARSDAGVVSTVKPCWRPDRATAPDRDRFFSFVFCRQPRPAAPALWCQACRREPALRLGRSWSPAAASGCRLRAGSKPIESITDHERRGAHYRG